MPTLDDDDDCPGCEGAPPSGYWVCPVCDAEHFDDDEEEDEENAEDFKP